MKIQFCGAAGSVTGSNYLLETEESAILIDCGMFQGSKTLLKRNYMEFSYDPRSIDAVLITHAHIDHSGLLPKLVKGGFTGKIYVARPTGDLLEVLLYDSAHIEEMGIEIANKKRKRNNLPLKKPLFTKDDVDDTLPLILEMEYHQEFKVTDDICALYKDAGHIMGSGYLELEITEKGITKKCIFSGDLGRSFQSFIKDPEVSEEADILFIESTYGNRSHRTDIDTDHEIVKALAEVQKTGGTLLIPSFAVGRTQEMIYRFFELFEKHKIPPVRIFIDSPMSTKVTRIYAEHKDLYDAKTKEYLLNGKDPLECGLINYVPSAAESKKLNRLEGAKVIISPSGMCHGGRILHHLKHNLWKKNTIVMFVGYQGKGTLGRRIIEGAKEVKIMGEQISVGAKVYTIGGLSAHADKEGLMGWLKFFKKSAPATFTVHGEPEVCSSFAAAIENQLGYKTITPAWQDSAEFLFTKEGVEIEMSTHDVETEFSREKSECFEVLNQVQTYIDELDQVELSKKLVAEVYLKKFIKELKESFNELKGNS